MHQIRGKSRLVFKSAGHYTNKHHGRHIQLLWLGSIPDRCRFSTASSERRKSRAPRAILKWTLAGASGLAIASAMAPHVSKHREKHDNASSSERGQKEDSKLEPPPSDPVYSFPKNVKNLIFVDSIEEDNADDKKDKTQNWHGLSFLQSATSLNEIKSALSSWAWPASFASLQEKSAALLLELSRGPGSLFSQIVHDPPDSKVHPECQWDAEVRLGDALCVSERAFLRMRKRKMRKAFAKMFDVEESEVDERDLPIVAIAGSGGGFRAMVNTTGSLIGAERTGLLDCTTYMAGISGSCWALGVLYSGVAEAATPQSAANHLVERIQTSYVDSSVLDMLITPPTNKYLLSGLLRKANNPGGTVSLVDLYGTLVSSRLLVPTDLSRLDSRSLSLHQFRRFIDDGSLPLPIFTAVRHGVPLELDKALEEAKSEQERSIDPTRKDIFKHEEEEIADLSHWMWFEFTPFEVGCDEIGAWIPTWSLGRRFEKGKSLERTPELSFSILNGIFASAFCASLQHYIKEVQPILRQLPTQLSGWLNDIVVENKREIGVVHPVEPDEVPNFVKGLGGLLKEHSPTEITERETLGFMDAGAELNIPYYPLFRRDVDCIIALDASADSQDLWFTRAEQYAAKRGISTWPKGARWPAIVKSSDSKEDEALQKATSTIPPKSESPSEAANRSVAEAQETEASGQAQKVGEYTDTDADADTDSSTDASSAGLRKSGTSLPENAGEVGSSSEKGGERSTPMSASTIWMGSSTGAQEPESTSSLLDKLEEQDLMRRDGIAIVYNPLIPNDAVPNFDPMSVSTWSFSMGKEETEKVLKVAEANFVEGQGKIVKLLKAIWLRKKAERERKEGEQRK